MKTESSTNVDADARKVDAPKEPETPFPIGAGPPAPGPPTKFGQPAERERQSQPVALRQCREALAHQLRQPFLHAFRRLTGLPLHVVWQETEGEDHVGPLLVCPLALRRFQTNGRLSATCWSCLHHASRPASAAKPGVQWFKGRCGTSNVVGIVRTGNVPLVTLVVRGRIVRRTSGAPPKAARREAADGRLAPRVTRNVLGRATDALRLAVAHLQTTAEAATVLQAARQRLRETERLLLDLKARLPHVRPTTPAVSPGPEHGPHGRAARRIVEAMMESIQCHYHRPITLKELAATLQMNADYLAHVFALNVGTTFSRYLLDLRLAKAEELLRDPSARVCEVAAAVGFASTDHFRHAFKTRLGLPPSAWRRK